MIDRCDIASEPAKHENMDGALLPMSAYALPCTLYSAEMKNERKDDA